MSKQSVAIVTGGSSGIGRATAEVLLKDGYAVVVGGRDRTKLEQVARELAAPDAVATVAGDIVDPATAGALVDTAVQRFGGVDVLVNSAGTFGGKPFVEVAPDELRAFLDGNLVGTYFVTQAVVRRMIDQGRGGSVVNLGTVLVDHAIGGFPVSAPLASKGALHALTIALAAELSSHRIRVNLVAPGFVRTPLSGPDIDSMAGLAMLDRVAEADEVAEAIHYLLRAEFVTGHVLNVDGGFVTARPRAT